MFLYIEDVEATDKYIFTLTPSRDKLIHVFDYSGKMSANFGQKFKVDFSIHKMVKDIANGIIYRSNIGT